MLSGCRESVRPSEMFWGMFWRSALWYAVAGVALGGLYGCAFAGSILYFLSVPFAIVGAVFGWITARGTSMRPLLGGVIGALAGLTLGGFPLAFAYGIALSLGGALGGMYGLATGLLCGIALPIVTRARHSPLEDIEQYRRLVGRAGFVLSTVAILCLWMAAFFVRIPLLSDNVRDVGSQGVYYGSLWDTVLSVVVMAAIIVVIPSLMLGLAAEWRGGFVLDWYAKASGLEPGAARPDHRLERVVESAFRLRGEGMRWVSVGMILIGILAAIVGVVRDHYGPEPTWNRHVRMPLPDYAQFSDIRLSPDGERLAIQSSDGRLGIWNVGDGRLVDKVSLDSSEIWALSPDGRLLADSCPGNAPRYCGRVLRTEDGSEVASLPNGGLNAFSWSQDSSMLAGAGGDEVRVWRTRDGALLHTLEGYYMGVQEPKFSSDKNILATNGEYSGDTILWSLEDGQRIRTLRPPGGLDRQDYESYGTETAFSPDGKLFARAGGGGQVTLWKVATGEVVRVVGGGYRASVFAFSPDGRLLATTDQGEGEITLWRVSDGAGLRVYDSPGSPVSDLAFSSNGDRLLSCDYALRVWPVEG
jgi:hypothetical protein